MKPHLYLSFLVASSLAHADILVDLDATELSPGPLAVWTNSGTEVGDFTAEMDTPEVAEVGFATGVTFNGTSQWYVGPTAPAQVTGNGSRSVEAWVYNPVVASEESVFSWSRRGGPDGTNVAFGHGTHDAFGAVGHWGNDGDVGWDSVETANDSLVTGDDQEVAGDWTYIVYTYDGTSNTTSVYTDGVLTRSDTHGVAINAFALANDGTTPLPFVVANQNQANGTRVAAQLGSMTIARIRAHDTVLDAATIEETHDVEAPVFLQTPVTLNDTDNDGLDDDWEIHFFGSKEAQDETGNDDMDGLDNLGEQLARTSPHFADTDGDDVSDGDEVTNGTLPRVADTDNDGLTDGQERDFMSNPLTAHSDTDGFTDLQEFLAGTDPNDEFDFPTPMPLVALDATVLPVGPLPTWTNLGTVVGDFNSEIDVPNVETINDVNGVTLDGANDWYLGPIAPSSVTGNNSRTVDAWVYNPVVAAEETIISWAHREGPDGTNVSFGHGSHDAFGAVGQWGNGPDLGWDSIETADDSKTTGDDQEEEGVWTYVAYVYDGLNNTTSVYTNGQLTRSDVNGPMNAHDGDIFVLGSQRSAAGVAGAIPGSLTIAKVNVYDDALSGTIITRQYDLDAPMFGRSRVNIVDGDGDLMDDDWEILFFTNKTTVEDAALDADSDGLTNGEEHARRQERRNGFVYNPNNNDSDGDDVTDGDEVNRMVLGEPAPTDPLDPDSDDDGLTDGEELFRLVDGLPAPTDPLNPDSDMDGFSDKIEVDAESDPNSAGSIPAIPVPAAKHRYSFSETGGSGTVLVDSISGQNGTIIDGGVNDATVSGGVLVMAGGGKDVSDYPEFPSGIVTGAGASGDPGDFSLEIWATPHSIQNWSRVFDFGASQDNFFLLSWTRGTTLNQNQFRFFANGTGDSVLNDFSVPNALNEEVLYTVVFDDNGGPTGNSSVILYKNGLNVATVDTTLDVTNLIDTNVWLGRSQFPDNTANASYNEFRVYDVALTPNEVVSSFNKGPDAQEIVQEFKIITAEYDRGSREFTITFSSPADMNYEIEISEDSLSGFTGLDDGITTDVTTTVSGIAVPEGVTSFFVRIRNNDFVAP